MPTPEAEPAATPVSNPKTTPTPAAHIPTTLTEMPTATPLPLTLSPTTPLITETPLMVTPATPTVVFSPTSSYKCWNIRRRIAKSKDTRVHSGSKTSLPSEWPLRGRADL